jgi:hypothetical protein
MFMKVVYILGVGRSGSTILDTVLSNHPQIEGAGEFISSMRQIMHQKYCACGNRANECPFWSEVLEEWKHLAPSANMQEYIMLQKKYEHVSRWILPSQAQGYLVSGFERYAEETYALFRALQSVSGKRIIVDSSKHRGRALALSRIPEIDLHFIHLVRDVRGVVWSLKKSFAKSVENPLANEALPAWRAAAQWYLLNLQAEWVRRRIAPEKSIRVRYEDFIVSPKETLVNIGRFIGCDLSQLADEVVAGKEMDTNHMIAGNRLRMRGKVKLRADNEWMYKLQPKEKLVITVIAKRMMRQYGYK